MNKITASNRSILFLSHLYGRSKDLCEGLEEDVVDSAGVTNKIIDTTYNREPLSVV